MVKASLPRQSPHRKREPCVEPNPYGQAKDAVGDAARSVQEQAAPLEEFLRTAIERRPYSVAVALGIGWFIGRMGGHSDYWD